MKYIWLFSIIVASSLNLSGQTFKAFLDAADDALERKDYYSALSYYSEALLFDTSRVDLQYDVAEAARNFNAYTKATKHYQYVVDNDKENAYPKASFFLANVLQMQGQYQKAKDYYRIYLSEHSGDDSYLTALANKQIASSDWALEKLENAESSVQISSYGDAINTEFSEFGALQIEDELIFTSMQFLPENSKEYSKKYISKLLKTQENVAAVEYAEGFNRKDVSTAHVTFNINKSRIYYTLCEYVTDSDLRCDLYSRAILGDGSLGEEKKLPSPINMDSVTNTQPAIGFDEKSGQEILYFVSDRKEGKGKQDIYKVNITGVDQYGSVENLTSINTAENDITPFFHNNSQVLYFSSDGYTSLGGFDIYRSLNENGNLSAAENIGSPYNTSYNDIYYTLNDDGDEALLSSNRIGSKYIDGESEACCYDIYKANISNLEINFNALTFDRNTLDSLEGATVKLYYSDTGELIGEITNDIANDHIFALERGKNYMVVTSKRGYRTDTMYVNTNRIYKSEDVVKRIYLVRETLQLDVLTFDKISRDALPGTTVSLYDLSDNTAQTITLTNEVGNDFSFDVIPGHRYKIVAQRDKYYEAVAEFNAIDEDGDGISRQELYLTRRDLNIYLPLAVYFDNDLPEKRTRSLTTGLTYTETFDNYIFRKFDFIDEYSKKLSGSEKVLGGQRIAQFFDEDVRKGYDRLHNFLEFIAGELRDGKGFNLSVKGYASPRADERYNLALSQRRVVSVLNEIRTFNNGELLPFIQNGQLKITELAYGESLAPDNVSDALYDQRNSIYSPEASRERRVEIVEIKSTSGLNN